VSTDRRSRENGYEANKYWSSRLDENFSLRGTGHLEYDERYNSWLYKAKANALRACLQGVSRDAQVLDIGSGVGWVVSELLGLGFAVEGCDIAPEAVARLNERFSDVGFFQFELGGDQIDRPDATYGVVTMLDVAYHVTDEERWLAGLGEIARVLSPGGRLVVSDGFGKTQRVPAPHVRFRSRADWQKAEDVGLSIVEIQPYFRWLSRRPAESWMRVLPDGVRGGLEYGLERVWPRAPHMHCAVLQRESI
jgi:SAM-dependent methyltransferase